MTSLCLGVLAFTADDQLKWFEPAVVVGGWSPAEPPSSPPPSAIPATTTVASTAPAAAAGSHVADGRVGGGGSGCTGGAARGRQRTAPRDLLSRYPRLAAR